MPEEQFVGFTQIIQSGFAFGRGQKPVLGAFAGTEVPEIAFKAIAGKLISLVHPKIKLTLRFRELNQRGVQYVTQEIFGINKMVA